MPAMISPRSARSRCRARCRAPPARYVTEFSEFEIKFESQEKGGQGVG